MKENYVIYKAENGYYVDVCDEEGNERKVVCTTDDELRAFMTRTVFAELKNLSMLNVNINYL